MKKLLFIFIIMLAQNISADEYSSFKSILLSIDTPIKLKISKNKQQLYFDMAKQVIENKKELIIARARAFQIIKQLNRTEEQIAYLHDYALNTKKPVKLRIRAIRAFSEIEKSGSTKLLSKLIDDSSPQIRKTVIYCTHYINKADKNMLLKHNLEVEKTKWLIELNKRIGKRVNK